MSSTSKIIQTIIYSLNQSIRITLLYLIKAYRFLISPYLGNRCRYYPSCSAYAMEAVQEHTFFYATALIVKRLLSCHPWHRGGYDPVPTKHKKKIFCEEK